MFALPKGGSGTREGISMKWVVLFAVVVAAGIVAMLATDEIRARRDAPDQLQRLKDATERFDEAQRALRP